MRWCGSSWTCTSDTTAGAYPKDTSSFQNFPVGCSRTLHCGNLVRLGLCVLHTVKFKTQPSLKIAKACKYKKQKQKPFQIACLLNKVLHSNVAAISPFLRLNMNSQQFLCTQCSNSAVCWLFGRVFMCHLEPNHNVNQMLDSFWCHTLWVEYLCKWHRYLKLPNST